MRIATARADQREALLALMDAVLRPDGAATRVWEDYPVALGPENLGGLLLVEEDGVPVAGLSCLVRRFRTSWGDLPVAVIGSVATAPARRGRGLSRALQDELLARLRRDGVPLAALWSEHPEYYAGRGFAPAGLEWHAVLDDWRAAPATPGGGLAVRDYRPEDLPAVARLYERHELRTHRRPGDAGRLYAMPGTRGLVATGPEGAVAGYAFCGRGLDFPGYVLEWAGAPPVLAAVLQEAKRRLGARAVLLPQSTEAAARALAASGAALAARPSGLWAVLRPDLLSEAARAASAAEPAAALVGRAEAWLGGVAADGTPVPGPLRLAVWGFDSN